MCCSPGGEQTRNLVLTGVYGNALAVRFRFSDFQTSVTFSFHFALQLSHLRFEELDAVVFRFAVCVQLSHFDTVIALQLSNLRFGISISLTECRGTRFFNSLLIACFSVHCTGVQLVQINNSDGGQATSFHQVSQYAVFVFDNTQTQLGSTFTLFGIDLIIQVGQLGLFELNFFSQGDVGLRQGCQFACNLAQIGNSFNNAFG